MFFFVVVVVKIDFTKKAELRVPSGRTLIAVKIPPQAMLIQPVWHCFVGTWS